MSAPSFGAVLVTGLATAPYPTLGAWVGRCIVPSVSPLPAPDTMPNTDGWPHPEESTKSKPTAVYAAICSASSTTLEGRAGYGVTDTEWPKRITGWCATAEVLRFGAVKSQRLSATTGNAKRTVCRDITDCDIHEPNPALSPKPTPARLVFVLILARRSRSGALRVPPGAGLRQHAELPQAPPRPHP